MTTTEAQPTHPTTASYMHHTWEVTWRGNPVLVRVVGSDGGDDDPDTTYDVEFLAPQRWDDGRLVHGIDNIARTDVRCPRWQTVYDALNDANQELDYAQDRVNEARVACAKAQSLVDGLRSLEAQFE